MTRKLIIFGNGLGMALDSDYFLLSRALEKVWDLDDFLSDEQKELIKACLDTDQCPRSEEELDILHQVTAHCNSLKKLGRGCCGWLNQHGDDFPIATERYIHKTAIELYNYGGTLPREFVTPLTDFIKRTKSHVATLNYDKLLYQEFISSSVLEGYRGYLIDGIWASRGFQEDNLVRKHSNNFGYYMHLHGSPLFFESGDKIYKERLPSLSLNMKNHGNHLVLTHVNHKRSVIQNSRLLSAYWYYLQLALHEASEIILFGYSGQDLHLNTMIKPHLANNTKIVKVIEWDDQSDHRERNTYWNDALGGTVTLIRLENILSYSDW
ncbi:SIR2 family protein [Cobetia amphilecti]|uniref:SIR2 family protein n=1 Tax=Cobetia amphilecti TaxID=1055104 RepID=A0AAP4WWW4_9GAMM|nr:SIR2 family protein [Cobetia amphilecti]MDO6670554.1 SIR2 family protein [Cobetia amphilecti]